MSVIAALIRAGVDPDLVAQVVAEIEAAALRGAAARAVDPVAEKRRAFDRERKRNSTGIPPESTGNSGIPQSPVFPDKEKSPHTPLKEINPSQTLTPFGRNRAGASFDDFLKAYPKRKGSNPKQPAEQKFNLIVKRGTDPLEIIAGAQRYAISVQNDDPQFTAQMVTWLNQGRWKDDYSDPPPRAGPRSQESAFSVVDRMLNGSPDERPDDSQFPSQRNDPFARGFGALDLEAERVDPDRFQDLRAACRSGLDG